MPALPFGKQDGQMTSSYSFKTIIMRNYLLSLLVALLAVTGCLPLAAQEAYAVFTFDKTLTFYYDNQRATRQNYERIYDMPKPGEESTWAGNYFNRQKNVMHVVFDASFSGYRPSSTNSWFAYCGNLQGIKGIRNLNTQNVADMGSMFSGCKALTSLDLSNFNTKNVTKMWSIFSDCKVLTSLDVSSFNTENVTYMTWMFYNCKALTSLDLSNFNTQNVTDMSWMFSGCESLTTIFSNSNWEDGHKVLDKEMFENCTKLKGTNTSFNAHKTGIEMANPTTGYFTSKTTGLTM